MNAPHQSLLYPTPTLPYLAEAAATQGDKELPPWCYPRPVTPSHVLQELDYAANLFRRAQIAIDAELAALAGARVFLNQSHVLMATSCLALLAAEVQLAAIERRAAA